MKLHRQGLDFSKHLSHLTRSGTNRSTTYIHHWEAKPRIMDGHYLLRHQTWLLFRNPAAYEMALETIDLRVCPGWYSGSFYVAKWVTQHPNWRPEIAGPPRLTRMLAFRASHLDNAELNSSCPNCTGLTKCEYCPTEFQLDAKNFNGHGVALVITRWLDLGEGRNLQDDWFRSHLWCYKGPPMLSRAGSIRAAYEGRHINIEKLLTPRYKTEMLRHSTHAYRANALAHDSAPATGCLGNSIQAIEKK
ncbi:hypothetical protein V490_05999 [Pseudogymnoascus sp. VKM F-3557]|nr:hypothetical protein V490_05999 [Pseudogymnoascus sp. VKM F-3557]